MEHEFWHRIYDSRRGDRYILTTGSEAAERANIMGGKCQKVSRELADSLDRISPKGYDVVITDNPELF